MKNMRYSSTIDILAITLDVLLFFYIDLDILFSVLLHFQCRKFECIQYNAYLHVVYKDLTEASG